jgi:hypothetical protein
MCGANSQLRQRQIASSASGQVGQRYHGRSRSVRADRPSSGSNGGSPSRGVHT